jgi:hypothetical protein
MNFYETPDLGLTAAFVTLGNKVTGIHMKEDRAFFSFEYSKHLMDQAAQYFGSGLEVNAKSYYYNLRDLKRAIHDNQTTKR